MVPGEGVEGAHRDPARAQLLRGDAQEAADVRACARKLGIQRMAMMAPENQNPGLQEDAGVHYPRHGQVLLVLAKPGKVLSTTHSLALRSKWCIIER